MPRHYMQDAPSPRQAAPQMPLTSDLAPNAISAWQTCAKCQQREAFVVSFPNHWPPPTPVCDECNRSEAIERQADRSLATPERGAECQQLIADYLSTWAQSIADAVAERLETERPRVEFEVRNEFRQKASSLATERVRAAIVAELQAKECSESPT